ncbi:MAG: outer membrane protein assembly factor BamB family protein, partial [Planctomycetota bacterium]
MSGKSLRFRIVCILVLAWAGGGASSGSATAADWPTFRRDNRRSGRTAEQLPAARLRQQWVHRSPAPPRPAWGGPARFDTYHGVIGIQSMRDYDTVYHVVVAGGSLYFGSSGDDSVHCLDAATGKAKWVFPTDGPVRIAPTCTAGKVYFGSDDGFAYCLRADDGALVWKFRPAPGGRRVVNDGRLIPRWPCRTGVLVEAGTAYCGFGMLPWKQSYLCAVDAATGEPEGPGRYVVRYERQTMEGPMLAAAERLVVPQGRVPPVLFERSSGKMLGSFWGSGGTFATITEDRRLFHAPGSKTGVLYQSSVVDRRKLQHLKNINAIIVSGNVSYVLTKNNVQALALGARRAVWSKPWKLPDSSILAGEMLFVGGLDKVVAFRAKDGAEIWKAKVTGRACGLAVAGGRLFVSTDEGVIYAFAPAASPAEAPDEEGEPAAREKAGPARAEKLPRLALAVGPYLRFTAPDSAVVRWQTERASPTILAYGRDGRERRIEDRAPKTTHEVRLTGLKKNVLYKYQLRGVIDGGEAAAGPFELDTYLNFCLPDLPDRPSPYADDEAAALCAQAAEHILSATGIDRGMCLVLGSGEGRLAYELARRSELRVVGVDTDAAKVNAARRALLAAGVYGRVTIHRVDSLAELPFVGDFANLVVSERMVCRGECAGTAVEVLRVLRPAGGLAFLGRPRAAPKKLSRERLEAWLKESSISGQISDDEQGLWVRIEKPRLPGSGAWSHQYGTPANAAYGGESLRGARVTGDLSLQWIGRPGARHPAVCGVRKPAPLSTGGRLFSQGLRRIVAQDAYNGTILWSLEVPGLERYNMPRDCGNWCADAQHVFAAVADKCWRIDAATGDISRFYDVIPGARKDWSYHWGYVARDGRRLLGSAVKAGTVFTDYWGPKAWFDARSGPATQKVCSDNIFALDKQSGKVRWAYSSGLIINSTITIGGGRVYFVESRNPKAIAAQSRRMDSRDFWLDQFIVALDAETGRKLWEKPRATAAGTVVFYLAYGEGKLVLVASDRVYRVYAFDAADGSGLWDVQLHWAGRDHGRHMSRPAILAGKVYVRPYVIDLASGELRPPHIAVAGRGCGTYALADKVAISRWGGTITMSQFATGESTGWFRLRPDCWLSAIPAAGMILCPEGGAGCSCGSWLETSCGLMPGLDLTSFLKVRSSFLDSVKVTLRKPLGGGDIYYTLDGTKPTLKSRRYVGPIILRKTAVIRAAAVGPGPVPRLGEEVSKRFERMEVRPLSEGKVNFQPRGQVPQGYVGDFGWRLNVREGKVAYGWHETMWNQVHRVGRRTDALGTYVLF